MVGWALVVLVGAAVGMPLLALEPAVEDCRVCVWVGRSLAALLPIGLVGLVAAALW